MVYFLMNGDGGRCVMKSVSMNMAEQVRVTVLNQVTHPVIHLVEIADGQISTPYPFYSSDPEFRGGND
jgi:hypothetical protein